MKLTLSTLLSISLLLLLTVIPGAAQSPAQPDTMRGTASTSFPTMVRFSGTVQAASGQLEAGASGLTFALYKDQRGGAALWLETQNVRVDATGHYSALLGALKSEGLPRELFSSGDARWLGVRVNGGEEQPRVLLVAVPYAMKAADAETIGGLAPSAFVLAAPATVSDAATPANAATAVLTPSSTPPPASNVTTTGGTVNAIPLFTTATNIQNSLLTQTGTSSVNVGGKLFLPATGTATAAKGFLSQSQTFAGSVFNSGTSTAVNQKFQWQAEPANNNTANASGTLNLLYGSGAAIPAETGLKINSKGQLIFVPGQSFPGTGKGSVTSVGLSAPASDFTVSGSPVITSGTLNFGWKIAPTNVNTPNAIVKRDASGSFNVKNINASGSLTVSTSNPTAIQGSTSGDGGSGVHGSALEASGTRTAIGVLGDTISTRAYSVGVFGRDGNSSGSGGPTLGVQGQSNNPAGIGVLGFNRMSRFFGQVVGSQRIGVWGDAEADTGEFEGIGVVGTSGTGVGVLAENGTGSIFPALIALGGSAPNGTADNGVAGIATTGGNGGCCLTTGEPGRGAAGIIATGGFGNTGSHGAGSPGVGGAFTGGGTDCVGNGCQGDGILSMPGKDPSGQVDDGLAGIFIGDIEVTGSILAGTKDFKIDHPLDPANKYLLHASVESSEMMNIYTGNVTTDGQGEATVQLPDWFEALNRDFRYQLTVIGQFAQAIVAREIQNHAFAIRTNVPNVKVSWQITSVRQDAFAKAHPLQVEEKKDARTRGFYLHPELYGAPDEKQMEWARHPQLMRQIKEQQVRQRKAAQLPQAAASRSLAGSQQPQQPHPGTK